MKKRFCKICFIVFAVVMLFAINLISASAETSGYYTYTVENGEATITSVSLDINGDITIPETLGGYPVTVIGDHSFEYCESLKSVIIPETVTVIGDAAFYHCWTLADVEIPDSVVSIGVEAFQYCRGLKSVVIPNNVTTLPQSLFYDAGIADIFIPKSVTTIEWCVFFSCSSFRNVYYAGSEEEWNKISIGNNNGHLPKVTMHYNYCPENSDSVHSYVVEEIAATCTEKGYTTHTCACGYSYEDNYTDVIDHSYSVEVMEPTCTEIGYSLYTCACGDRFKDNYVVATGHKDDNTDSFCDKCSAEILIIAGGKCGPDLNWTLDSEGTLLIFGTGIMQFQWLDGAEYYMPPWHEYCKSIKQVIIKSGVTNIGSHAFVDRWDYNHEYRFESIIIPDSVTSIGWEAFFGCGELEHIIVPDSVTVINMDSFMGTAYYNNEDNWENGALYLGKALYSVKDSAVVDGSFTIKDGTSVIADHAFYSCKKLTSVTIPASVVSISGYAFDGKLTDVYFAGSQDQWNRISIGDTNYNLEDATIHFNHYYCTVNDSYEHNIISTEKTEPTCTEDGYTACICECGYAYCKDYVDASGHKALAPEIIAPTCTEDGYTTYTCECGYIYNDNYVYFTGHKDNDSDGICDVCSENADIDISKYFTYELTDSGKAVITDVDARICGELTIPATLDGYAVTGIDDFAFANCVRLTDIIIPEHITEIGLWVFAGCRLNSLGVPMAARAEDSAFSECSVEHLYYCGSEEEFDDQYYEEWNYGETDAFAGCDIKNYHFFSWPCEDLGHNFTVEETAPTCRSEGEIYKKCECGNTYTQIIESLPHSYSSKYTVDKKATCKSTGSKSKHCTAKNCTARTSVTKIPKLDHSYEKSVTKATLKADGKIKNTCKKCGYTASKVTKIYKPASFRLSTTEYTYNQIEKKPVVTVKDSKGNKLVKDVDYTVSYESGRVLPGKYTVTITFKGKYDGVKRLYFTIKPAVPTGINSTETLKTITLKWKKVAGADGYRVYKYNTKNKKYEYYKTTTSTSLKITDLKGGTGYKFRIRAYTKDEGTISGKYSPVFATSTKTKTPTLKVTSTKKGVALLSWSNVTGESGYQVYYTTNKNGTYKKLDSYKVNVVKTTASKLTSGKIYYFKVRAYTKTNSGTVYSSWSTVKSIKIK